MNEDTWKRGVSPTVNPNWKQYADKLRMELQEINREDDRQKLLDELSTSQTRNLELERALAALAREKERVCLIERERVLRRAQVAQATAQIVYEANWARSRMESEMKQAKMRAMIFNDEPPMPPEAVAVASMPSMSSNLPSVSSIQESQPPTVASSEPTQAGPAPPPRDSLSADLTLPAPTAVEVVANAAESIFGGILDTYYGSDKPQNERAILSTAPTRDQMADMGAQVLSTGEPGVVSDKATTPSLLGPTTPVVASTTPLVAPSPQPAVTASTRPTTTVIRINPNPNPKPPTVIDSSAPAVRSTRKIIPTTQKGQWTVPELQVDAEVSASSILREDTCLRPELFGLPGRENVPELVMDPVWADLQAEWLETVAPQPVRAKSPTRPPKDLTESLINDNLGIEPAEEVKEPQPVEAPEEGSRTPIETPPPSKDKKKCVIM
jgi:hypothetical protein